MSANDNSPIMIASGNPRIVLQQFEDELRLARMEPSTPDVDLRIGLLQQAISDLKEIVACMSSCPVHSHLVN